MILFYSLLQFLYFNFLNFKTIILKLNNLFEILIDFYD